MFLLRCCTIIVFLTATIIGGVINLGKKYDFTKGSFPFLLVDPQLSFDTIPDLAGKTIVVTGANVGLGKSAVKHFFGNGAKVVMVCRSLIKCNKAKEQIVQELKHSKESEVNVEKLIIMEADLGSFASIRRVGDLMNNQFERIHSLVLNAGLMNPAFSLTDDGIEQTIGVNHFGHFYLTQLLLPLVENAQPSTIVSVSSSRQFLSYPEGVRLSLERINDENDYAEGLAYGQSKLANVLFAQELSKRMKAQRKKVFVNSVHPGAVNTEFFRHKSQLLKDSVRWVSNNFPNKLVFESDYAALTEVYVAVSEKILSEEVTGKYFVPIGEECGTSSHAKNMTLQKGLWELSESILKEKGFL